jgi:hypothetical protein
MSAFIFFILVAKERREKVSFELLRILDEKAILCNTLQSSILLY